VLVELKARFDEANNIAWARRLEDAGVHVAFGSAKLKTHVKTVLVVRREADGIRRYVHLGTGNYNARTARVYTDVGLFTANPSTGADASDLFNSLTGYSRQQFYRKLLVAPHEMRQRFIDLIKREAAFAERGLPSRIVAKMNALVDPEIIVELYAASRAGTEIDLIVRGICCLRPGLSGHSDRVRVVSIIGRFLEHSRMWSFANGGSPEYYIGSADWMPRNFDRRVEAVAPIDAPEIKERIASLLATYLNDDRQAWDLGGDGRWVQRPGRRPETAAHSILLRDSWGQPSSSRESEEKTSRPGAMISTGTPATSASNSDL
jgi:polyphosphate kinase